MHDSCRVRGAWELDPLVPELSEAGWAWVMSLAEAQADDNQPGPPSLFVAAAVASQAAVSRADTLTLLDAPGWARCRLRAPWVADELVLGLADHSRPVEDRLTVAMSGCARSLPPEGYTLLATDPDADVRLAAERRPLPDDMDSQLIDKWRSVYSASSAIGPLMATEDGLEQLIALTSAYWSSLPHELAIARAGAALLAEGADLSVLLAVEQLPTWVNPRTHHSRYLQRTAASYVAYASPTTSVRDTAMALLSDGWDQALPALVSAACALEGEPVPT